jgi:phage/conjugal plasmid C-4 type zinc finger TraR family protein
MDEGDHAQARAEELRQQAIARMLAAREGVSEGDGTCTDCGEDIPEQRLKALNGKADRCAPCQEDHERQRGYLKA